jgi:DNA-binding transcriptional MerR regulator
MGMTSDVPLLSIGEFSRMTFLSVKTLRHYHETGLLAPRGSTRRRAIATTTSQVTTAQVIRRFRDLDLPIEQLRAFLDAPTRNEERRDRGPSRPDECAAPGDPGHRRLAAADARRGGCRVPGRVPRRAAPHRLAVRPSGSGRGRRRLVDGCVPRAHRTRSSAPPAGTDGALFPTEFFADEEGDLVAFVPSRRAGRLPARVTAYEVPAARLAVTTFDGPPLDLDRRYGAVGRWVLDQAASSPGPVRERYLPTGDEGRPPRPTTEVCWPRGRFEHRTRSAVTLGWGLSWAIWNSRPPAREAPVRSFGYEHAPPSRRSGPAARRGDCHTSGIVRIEVPHGIPGDRRCGVSTGRVGVAW